MRLKLQWKGAAGLHMSQDKEMFGMSVVRTMTLCLYLEKVTEWPHFSHFIAVTDGDSEHQSLL